MAEVTSEYLTLAAPAQGLYREKMSKFISLAFPVDSSAEARDVISRIANEYHDARHVCWAYMIGAAQTEYQSNDNGEPSGTAGKPILGQIRSFGLTNVVVIVVRYFGGIKLGTSGLIVAYREAAREALDAAEKVTRCEETTVAFHFPYLAMNDVMRVVKDSGCRIVAQEFDNSCFISLSIRADHADALRARIAGIDGTSFAD